MLCCLELLDELRVLADECVDFGVESELFLVVASGLAQLGFEECYALVQFGVRFA